MHNYGYNNFLRIEIYLPFPGWLMSESLSEVRCGKEINVVS